MRIVSALLSGVIAMIAFAQKPAVHTPAQTVIRVAVGQKLKHLPLMSVVDCF